MALFACFFNIGLHTFILHLALQVMLSALFIYLKTKRKLQYSRKSTGDFQSCHSVGMADIVITCSITILLFFLANRTPILFRTTTWLIEKYEYFLIEHIAFTKLYHIYKEPNDPGLVNEI